MEQAHTRGAMPRRAWSASRSLRIVMATTAVASASLTVAGGGSPASASLEWPSSTTAHPETVTADALPTVQINGVAWTQEIVGNTVYVGGSFTSARPAGSAPGQNEVPRNNFLAYDLTTGQLLSSVVLNANAQVRTIEKSPDGSRIYIGGDFTNFGGQTRNRIAAVNTASNTLVSNFSPNVLYHVHGIAVSSNTIYVGGNFQGVGNQTRLRLAAFNTTGGLLSWAPSVPDREVWAVEVSPDGQKVAIGGAFETLNGTTTFGRGFAVVDGITGATLPFAATQFIRNGGVDGAVTALSTDGELLYGSGYTFGRAAGTLEGVFAAEWGNGAVRWVNDCHGDTYSIHPEGPVVYAVGHAHYCGNVGGFGQPDTWEFYRGLAMSKEPAGTVARERLGYTSFVGQARPDLLNFFPTIAAGSFTGMSQGAWSVTSNDRYVVMGGEFPSVNGTAQYGLVRFQRRQFATNRQGPTLFNASYPINVRSLGAGEVTINWQANRDRDDANLQYTVYRRTGGAGNGSIRHQRSAMAPFWNRPVMTFTDTADPGGQYQYRVQVTDGYGNFANSLWTDVTVAASGATSAYVDSVLASEPDSFWQLDESGGSVAADSVGWRGGTYPASGVTRSIAPATGAGNAVQLNGATGTFVRTASYEHPPHVLSLEAWFRAPATANGGLIIGFNRNNTSNSGAGSASEFDRHLYMAPNGRIHFGVNAVTPATVTNNIDYRDNQWHHVVGTLGADGMQLFVDGALVNSRTDVDNARTGYYGYWRIGGGVLDGYPGFPNNSTNRWFDGFLDDVALYKKVLSGAEVAGHFGAAGFDPPNVAPTAAFQSSVNGQQVTFNAAGSSDSDGTITNYAWTFGDGSPTQNTAQPSVVHNYAAPGNYTVTLTVTDNDNGTAQASSNVSIAAANVQPLADFDITLFGKDASFDAGDSSDPDGTISNYRYDFGDGSPVVNGTNPVVSHTYGAAGNYTVTLTVTDNANGTGAVQHVITTNELSAPPVNPVPIIAADSFERTVVGGLGNADTGGAWTLSGSAANYSVGGGTGKLQLSAGGQLAPYLGSVGSSNSDTRVDVALDKAPTGGGVNFTVVGRRVGTTGDYRALVRFNANGSLTAVLTRRLGGVDTNLAVTNAVAGVVPAVGQTVSVRFQAFRIDETSTQLALKVWLAGQQEPSSATLQATDTTSALQAPGSVGVVGYLSGSASNAPVTVSIDNLSSTDPTAGGNATPTARFTSFIDGTATTFDASLSTDDAPIASYSWNFGDGSPAGSGQIVNHTYLPGVYTVVLTVTDAGGLQHTMSAVVTIE
jgi:PKD repeat protein